MLVLLSPSKNLHNSPQAPHRYQLPRLHEQAQTLITALQKVTPKALQKLMDINDKLAALNAKRYSAFTWPHTADNATAAIYTFRGEVYLGFEAGTMTTKQADMADSRVRILSGLYGVLRPLDIIQPYRLEMSTELKVGRKPDLYAFWGDTISTLLAADIAETNSKEVINLASQEYYAAVKPELLGVPVVDIHFLEERNGKLQFLSFNAKRSRGWVARYIVDNNIKKSKDLQAYTEHDYSYNAGLSSPQKMVFVR